MFFNQYGYPVQINAENENEFNFYLLSVKLLTSIDEEMYIPSYWEGTIYGSSKMIDAYCERFKPNNPKVSFKAVTPYIAELFFRDHLKFVPHEVTMFPAGTSRHGTDLAFYLLTSNGNNTLITNELSSILDPATVQLLLGKRITTLYMNDKYCTENNADGMELIKLIRKLCKPRRILGIYRQVSVTTPF